MFTTLRSIAWLVMAFFAIVLFAITAEYLSLRTDINFLLEKQDLIGDVVWMPTFYLHVVSGMLVILIGPFQFIKKLRKMNIDLHRFLGKIYAYGILAVAAPTGLIMAFYAEGGFWSSVAFTIMSGLWILTTLLAILKIKNGDIVGHQKWMIRSYALSFAAVTLRLLVPLFSEFYMDKNLIIISTAWLSWMLNLLVAEGIILATFKTNKV